MTPFRNAFLFLGIATAVLALAACSEPSLPEEAGYGPNPILPAPKSSWLPTIKVAEAVGWKPGEKPLTADGGQVTAFATGLQHPRWLYESPNGDVLVAESDAPPKPDDKQGGVRAWVQGLFMKKAGSRTPSANRITLLRDSDGDGVAETKSVFLDKLTSPFGMALVGDQFYIANADAVVRVPHVAGEMRSAATPVKLAELPAGRNHHWTKSLLASPDGSKLYVGVGSNSNVGENGMVEEERRAAVLEIDTQTGTTQVFASGLRNPVGIDWNPCHQRALGRRERAGRDRR